jgi:hypothetical protein
MNYRIVILQRGWVMVGKYWQSGDECKLENAQVIRVWGTTKGLGELRNGPTEKTILDPVGTVNFHILTVIASIEVSDNWAKVL